MQPQAQFDRILSICKFFLPLYSIRREICLTPGLYLPVQTSLLWCFRFFKVCFPQRASAVPQKRAVTTRKRSIN